MRKKIFKGQLWSHARFSKVNLAIFTLILAVAGGYYIYKSFAAGGNLSTSCSKYSSTSGNDTNSGSQTSPYRTIQKLINNLSAGQTGCLMGGIFTTESSIQFTNGGSPGNPLAITTASGYSRATVKSAYWWIKDTANYVTIDNLAIDGAGNSQVTMQIFGDYATISNSDITNENLSQSCVLPGDYDGTYGIAQYTTITHNTIHNCGLASNGKNDHGIYLNATRYATVTYNTIYGNCCGWGIQLWEDAQNSDIEYNTIDGNGGGNIIIAGAVSATGGPSSNNYIANNILSNPTTDYNVDSFWSGPSGTNNTVTLNCVWNAPSGNFAPYGGFTQTNNTNADPLYVNRAAKDFSLQSGSLCVGKGSYSSGGSGCPNGDVSGDCHVSLTDLSILLSNWASVTNTTCDLNRNGTVDIFDLSILLKNYGS